MAAGTAEIPNIVVNVPAGVDHLWFAQSLFRKRKYDECIVVTTKLLTQNPYDQAAWYLKCRAITQKNYIDDLEVEEEGVADILMDQNAVAAAPRPGTSLNRPTTSSGGGSGGDAARRPMTASGRPMTGFARPGTSNRPGTSSRPGSSSVERAFAGGRPGTSRPATAAGRALRLGTASMLSEVGGPFINVDKLDLKKYATRQALARALCDYILYAEHNPKKAVELAAAALSLAGASAAGGESGDWWWNARLGKAYYQLGMLRDAEKMFNASLRASDMVVSHLELAKVYIRLDQPLTALETYKKASAAHPGDVSLILASARVHDGLRELQTGAELYRTVLQYDAGCVEAVACLAAHHFYCDQPEVALRFYRRLLQCGVSSPELWSNLGLCCFYSGQYDLTLGCFERAIATASDDSAADVWFNVAQVAIGIGDLQVAYEALKVAIACDPGHAESLNNLGVLEMRKGRGDQARAAFRTAAAAADWMYEPTYNAALLAFKLGEFQEAYMQVQASLAAFPDHTDSQELLKQLKQHFAGL